MGRPWTRAETPRNARPHSGVPPPPSIIDAASDAMGCQTAIARQSRAQEGDSRLALQKKHHKAYKALKHPFHTPSEHHGAGRTAEHGLKAFADAHGRLGRRLLWSIAACAALPALAQWPLRRTVMVGATMRTAHAHVPTTSHDRLFLASLSRSATGVMTMIRQPWHIDHRLHWSLDVTLQAERWRSRTDHAAAHRVALRHVALNLLRQEPAHPGSIRRKRRRCRLDEHYLLTVISGAT